jgi:hypothetical protein
MIELTTGVVFLVTSLYGSQQGDVHTANISKEVNQVAVSETVPTKSNIMDPKAMEQYLKTQFKDTPILVDIARCESSFRQYDSDGKVLRGKANRDDVGVMQINEKYNGESAKKLGYDIYTTDGNIAFAKHLYETQGADPWVYSSKCWAQNQLAKK